MKRKSVYNLCINDIILAAALACAALVLAVLFFALRGRAAGNTLYVFLNGEEYGIYSLDTDAVIHIDSDYGSNVIEIKDGNARMTEADCPDRYCVTKGEIYRTGETVVCLPHRLAAEIRSEDASSDEFDVIAE